MSYAKREHLALGVLLSSLLATSCGPGTALVEGEGEFLATSAESGPKGETDVAAADRSLASAVVMEADGEVRALLDLLNQYRAQHGLAALTPSVMLTHTARWMAADMAAKNYFSHTDSLGRDPFTRMSAFGYGFNTWKGENLLAGSPTAVDALNLWKGSPGHNANLLGANFRAVGLARVYNPSSAYGWYWAQEFGGLVEAPATYTPPSYSPIGVLDEVSQNLARGWACDPDAPETSIQVHVYVGGPAGSGAPGFAVTANRASEAAVNTLCRGGTAHRWEFALSGNVNNLGKGVWAYGINVGGGGNSLLAGSPKTVPGCSTTGRAPIGVHDGNVSLGNGLFRAWGWACDLDAPGASIDVHVYAGGPSGSGARGYLVRANMASEAAVNSICGGGAAHRWEFVYSGARVPVYAYGISVCGGGNAALAATPR